MRVGVFAFAALISFSNVMFAPASAQAATSVPAPMTAAPVEEPTLALTAPTGHDGNSSWGFSGDIHGAGTAGLGLLVHTPILWDVVGLRVGYNFESAPQSLSSRYSYGAIVAGLKFNLFRESTAALFPYVAVNFNFYTLSSADVASGSKISNEVMYGIEWRHRALAWGGALVNHAVFIEGGFGASDTQLTAANSGARIGEGFVSRIGMRRLF